MPAILDVSGAPAIAVRVVAFAVAGFGEVGELVGEAPASFANPIGRQRKSLFDIAASY